MKAIINGVRYNTETAIEVGCSSSNEGRSNFAWWEATLYKTPRSGRFFLAGAGGPMSRFSRSAGQNSWTGGEAIQLMDEDEAREWAEQHLTVEEVEAAFEIEDA